MFRLLSFVSWKQIQIASQWHNNVTPKSFEASHPGEANVKCALIVYYITLTLTVHKKGGGTCAIFALPLNSPLKIMMSVLSPDRRYNHRYHWYNYPLRSFNFFIMLLLTLLLLIIVIVSMGSHIATALHGSTIMILWSSGGFFFQNNLGFQSQARSWLNLVQHREKAEQLAASSPQNDTEWLVYFFQKEFSAPFDLIWFSCISMVLYLFDFLFQLIL